MCPINDSAALAHGVQCQLPFLDETVVSYAFAIPGHVRAPSAPRRLLLRRLAGNMLAPALANLPSADGALPMDEWIAHPLGAVLERAIGRYGVFRSGVLSGNGAHALLREHRRAGGHATALWALLILAEWCEALGLEHLAGSPPARTELAHSRS